MKFIRSMLMVFLVGIIMYSVKIPFLNQVPIYQVIFPVCSIFLLIAMSKTHTTKSFIYTPLRITMISWLALTAWGAVLSLINSDLAVGKDYLYFDLGFVFVPFVIAYYSVFDEHEKTIKGAFFTLSSIIALSGIYESLTGNYYHLTKMSYLYSKNMLGFYRPNTIFFNINDSATFMLFSMVIAFLFAQQCKNKRIIRIASVVMFGGNIVLTESLGALLGMAVFLAVYFLQTRRDLHKAIIVLIVTFVSALALAWLVLLGVEFVYLSGREEVWTNSLYNLSHSFFMGTGPGKTEILNASSWVLASRVSAVHNFFLEVVCDYGIPGLAFIGTWYVQLWLHSRRQKAHLKNAVIIYAGLVAFLPVSISSSSLFQKVIVIAFFAVLIAQLNRNERVLSAEEVSDTQEVLTV